MQRSSTSPDEHIASLPDEVREDIATLDAAIVSAMPGEERVLWEGKFWGGTDQRIIGYGLTATRDAAAPRVSGSSSGWRSRRTT